MSAYQRLNTKMSWPVAHAHKQIETNTPMCMQWKTHKKSMSKDSDLQVKIGDCMRLLHLSC